MDDRERERFDRQTAERERDRKGAFQWAIAIMVGMLLVVGLVFGTVWAWKSISVWSSQQSGKAQLAEAEFSKQVQLEEAKANLESEKLNAQAEVERAKGAAEAIEIEGGNLTENYIRYLWVRNLERGNNSLIYVPTEGGIPIMEAGRTPEAGG